ncbi:MAG: EAL domain-containing protein, partial [Anaerotignum sp.]
EELKPWLNEVFSRLRTLDRESIGGQSLHIHAGIYFLSGEDRDAELALFQAEQGCWLAEEEGVDYAESETKVLRDSQRLRQNLMETEEAIDKAQMKLFLQPLTDAKSGDIIGAEALTRWQHPEMGLLGPAQFVEMMEQEGTISKLDYYVLRNVCELLEDLQREEKEHIFITCNFSAFTIDSAELTERFQEILSGYTFRRENLVVEVTEGVRSKNPYQRQKNLESLREMGLSVALDDFGSGYTSFRDLSTHSYDYVKLDRALLLDAAQPFGKVVLEELIRFSHALELHVLCEGVETEEQVELLRGMDCDILQGFYFCRPIPEEEGRKLFPQSKKKAAIPFPGSLSANGGS